MQLAWLCALALVACGEETVKPDAGHSEIQDTGVQPGPDPEDGGSGETQVVDAGEDAGEDAGGADDDSRTAYCKENGVAADECVGECDPVRNLGCTAPNTFCRPSFMRDVGYCDEVQRHFKQGERCNFSYQDCEPTTVCVGGGHGGTPTNEPPICYKICYARTGVGCESLGDDYYCDNKDLVTDGATGSKLALCRKKAK